MASKKPTRAKGDTSGDYSGINGAVPASTPISLEEGAGCSDVTHVKSPEGGCNNSDQQSPMGIERRQSNTQCSFDDISLTEQHQIKIICQMLATASEPQFLSNTSASAQGSQIQEEQKGGAMSTECEKSSSGPITQMEIQNTYAARVEKSEKQRSEPTGAVSEKVYIGWNIPPSLHEPRINNTDAGIGIAEQQHSFRTLSSRGNSLPPISTIDRLILEESPPALFQQSAEPMLNPLHQSRFTHPASQQDAEPESIEDNTQNIDMFPSLTPMMTARLVHPDMPNGTQSGHPGQGRGADAVFGNGPPVHPQSQSSIINSMTLITDEVRVIKLPRSIIKLLKAHLEVRSSSGTWKELVELHGWNYQRTYLFDNEHHEEGVFCALLREGEFQGYTLGHLKEDLRALPRLDLLEDLDEKIEQHNARANMNNNIRSYR